MKTRTVIIIVLMVGVILNATAYLFFFKPYMETKDVPVQEVERLPGWIIKTSIGIHPEGTINDFSIIAAKQHKTFSIQIVEVANNTLVPFSPELDERNLTYTKTEEYIILTFQPTEITTTVSKLKGARGYSSALKYAPNAYDMITLAHATQYGFDSFKTLAVQDDGEEGRRENMRFFSPVEQNSSETDNIIYIRSVIPQEDEAEIVIDTINQNLSERISKTITQFATIIGQEPVIITGQSTIITDDLFFTLQID